MCGLREENTQYSTNRINFNSVVYSDSKDPSIHGIINMFTWKNTKTKIIIHSYKAVEHGQVDIQTHYHKISRSVDTSIIKYSYNIVYKKLKDMEHSIVIKAMIHAFFQLRCIYCNWIYSWFFSNETQCNITEMANICRKVNDIIVTRHQRIKNIVKSIYKFVSYVWWSNNERLSVGTVW